MNCMCNKSKFGNCNINFYRVMEIYRCKVP